MATRIQVTIDCADPDRLARFWAEALGYRLQEPPDGFDSWQAYWVSRGLPPEEVEDGYDAIVDPDGVGPRIWFQPVPEGKVVKNPLPGAVRGGRRPLRGGHAGPRGQRVLPPLRPAGPLLSPVVGLDQGVGAAVEAVGVVVPQPHVQGHQVRMPEAEPGPGSRAPRVKARWRRW
jgi:catechol 2,3-dioxygenase-like lactoylglutathione lyase family enzyme